MAIKRGKVTVVGEWLNEAIYDSKFRVNIRENEDEKLLEEKNAMKWTLHNIFSAFWGFKLKSWFDTFDVQKT